MSGDTLVIALPVTAWEEVAADTRWQRAERYDVACGNGHVHVACVYLLDDLFVRTLHVQGDPVTMISLCRYETYGAAENCLEQAIEYLAAEGRGNGWHITPA